MGIIFDLDGTVLDSLRLHEHAVKLGFDTVLGKDKVSIDFIRKNIRYPFSVLVKNLNTSGVVVKTSESKKALAVADDYMTLHMVARKVKFFNGARETMSFAKNIGIKVCIATSMNTTEIKRFIPALKLRSLSTIIVNSKNPKKEKPNPIILNEAIRLARMKRKTTYYIGDSPFDLLAANNAGIQFLGIFNRKELSKKAPFFANFKELKKYIKDNRQLFVD